jgi:hypothetical protein
MADSETPKSSTGVSEYSVLLELHAETDNESAAKSEIEVKIFFMFPQDFFVNIVLKISRKYDEPTGVLGRIIPTFDQVGIRSHVCSTARRLAAKMAFSSWGLGRIAWVPGFL